MSFVRRLLRGTGVALVSAACYVPLALTALLTRSDSPRRAKIQSTILRRWSQAIRWLIGMRTDVIGAAPKTTGLFVANHLSYVDIVLLASEMRTAFVSKREVRHWPLVGHLVTIAGTIYVDRERHRSLPETNRQIRTKLDAETSVVIFAEGSSTAGETVLPFRPSLLKMAADHDFPVNYGYLTYRIDKQPGSETRTADEICWWGEAGFARHIINLLGLPGFAARLVFGESPKRGDDRKSLARELHTAVSQQLNEHRWKFEA
ncbi:MAG: lysophospholipid acyltransferase family protein [Pseudomonadota bacterium]